ncbi:MAG: ferritin family protein [Thermoanaerobaculales bacterium]|jgi:rubrerythrin|nr:ferritin family protein [Thermoanaerobaculales bacterium]
MALVVDFSRMDGQDALDVAKVVEDEAQLAYEHLAEWVAGDGNVEAAEFFSRMAGREKRHKEEIAARRTALFGDAPPRHDESAPWQAEVPDYEALGREVTLAQAFDVAMGAETRAHDFYAEALEFIAEPEVAELFDWLRKAEIEHQRMLRDEMDRLLGSAKG